MTMLIKGANADMASDYKNIYGKEGVIVSADDFGAAAVRFEVIGSSNQPVPLKDKPGIDGVIISITSNTVFLIDIPSAYTIRAILENSDVNTANVNVELR